MTGQKWVICRLFFSHRTRCTDRPKLHHGMLGSFPLKFGFQHDILDITRFETSSKVYEQDIYIDGITAFLCDMSDRSMSAR